MRGTLLAVLAMTIVLRIDTAAGADRQLPTFASAEGLGAAVLFTQATAQAADNARQSHRTIQGPLRVHPKNPRYFTDGSGGAIYLTGSHTWLNLQDGGSKFPPAEIRSDQI